MMNQELTDEELLYASPEDWAFYNKCIEGLPSREGMNGDFKDKFGVEIPYHSGPHILRHFRDTLGIVKPKKIIEIGLNLGHGSRMFLELDENLVVFSVDVSKRDETFVAGTFLQLTYPERFAFTVDGSDAVKDFLNQYKWDMIFIDGDHSENAIVNDISFAKEMQIPYILFDDYYKKYGDTKEAIAKFPELELVKDMNNLRLYKVNYDN